MPVRDGPSCPGCGLPNYEGLCPVCRGDEQGTRDEGLPYPFDERGQRDALERAGRSIILGRPPLTLALVDELTDLIRRVHRIG